LRRAGRVRVRTSYVFRTVASASLQRYTAQVVPRLPARQGLALGMASVAGLSGEALSEPVGSLHSHSGTRIDGSAFALKELTGKPVLIVNVASR